jgi:uncharacterized RDD family membrane protein YckC
METAVLAGWWQRVGAALIDAVAVVPLSSLLLIAAGEHPVWHHTRHLHGEHLTLRFGLTVLAALLYYPPLMRLTNGQTLGKRALGIRVVRVDGLPMTALRSAWRDVAIKTAVLSAGTFLPGIGPDIATVPALLDSLWPLWDDQNRALHDFAAGTRVQLAATPGSPPAAPRPTRA